ncbi:MULTISPECIES: hypothetical protein [unclassified Modestobacter]
MRLTARRAAVEAATAGQRQLLAMVITAPEPVRARFRCQTTGAVIATVARLRPGASGGDAEAFTALTVLHDPARRIRFLKAEALDHEGHPRDRGVLAAGPAGADRSRSHRRRHRAHRLVPPGRCRNDAAFAMLAGTAPIPASSGKTVSYRLNR